MNADGQVRPTVRHKLTGRDLQILRFIEDEPWNTCESIREKFWPGKNQHHHYRRLRILQNMDLVVFFRKPAIAAWGFRLTQKGRGKL